MKLSIIIVSWNVREDLVRSLDSIKENRPSCRFQIIIVDNGSTDGTVEVVEKNYPEAEIVANDENRGFAAANNQGVRCSIGEYLLFLNPDTLVHPNSMDILIRFMDDNKEVGACGPRLLNGDGTVQPSVRRFPTFRGALYRHTIFRSFYIFRREYKEWLMKDFEHNRQTDVDQIMGAALMVRRTLAEAIGCMDENFFMYYEEVDLCYRIKKAGWRIIFLPEALVTHYGGRSSGQIPVKKRIMMLSSLLKFFRKHRGRFSTRVFSCIFKPAIIARDLSHIVSDFIKYGLAAMVFDKEGREKYADKVRNSAAFIGEYVRHLFGVEI